MATFAKFSKTKRMNGSALIRLSCSLLNNSLRYTAYRHFGFPKILPKIVRISITNKCDSRCKACNIWKYYTQYPEKLKEEIRLDELKQFVDNNPFLEDIGLTGGQVTLHPDLLDMWLYLDKKGYRTGGATNSVNLKRVISIQKETIERLSGKHTHLLLLSLDGLEKEHDYLRGISGNFKNSIKLLKWTLEKQKDYPFIDLSIAHTVTTSNYKRFPEFVEYLTRLGVTPNQISFRPAVSSERFRNLNSKETFNKNKNLDIIKVFQQMKNNYKEYNNYAMNGMIKYLQNPRKLVIPCYAGYTVFNIDPYWNVFACMDATTKMGNLRKTNFNLARIWNSKLTKRVQENVKRGHCHNCWNPCFSGPSMISNPPKIIQLCYEYALGRLTT